jgi:hypothetical protein
MQVSDRQVSLDSREFDPSANKALVYQARNAIAVMGYCGRACMENLPTDQWIAATLRGRETAQRESTPEWQRPAALHIGRGDNLDLGAAILRLRDRVEAVMMGDHMGPLQVSIGGWQWRRGVCRPLLQVLRWEMSGKNVDYSSDSLPRYWHWDGLDQGRFYYVTIPLPGLSDPSTLLPTLSPVAHSPTQTRDVLVDEQRRQAAAAPTIGEDATCVLIPPPSSGRVDVTFVSGKDWRVGVAGRPNASTAAHFTPWVVGPGISAAPMAASGGMEIGLGVVTVHMGSDRESSTPGTGQAFFGSQRRPRPPRR